MSDRSRKSRASTLPVGVSTIAYRPPASASSIFFPSAEISKPPPAATCVSLCFSRS